MLKNEIKKQDSQFLFLVKKKLKTSSVFFSRKYIGDYRCHCCQSVTPVNKSIIVDPAIVRPAGPTGRRVHWGDGNTSTGYPKEMRVRSRSSHRPWNRRAPFRAWALVRPSQRRPLDVHVYQVTADTCKPLYRDLSVHDEHLQSTVHHLSRHLNVQG